ncbi:endonuclease [Enemella dayhoffiae]|uniref:Endonuclease n=1 Tax=Enemella dayhoffiae TaxID=2016507 RepID=A0A255GZD5_9ACTN|nr:endonuclease [Enemella dayhoffiae]
MFVTMVLGLGALLGAGAGTPTLLLGAFPRLQLRDTRLTQLASFVHLGLVGWLVASVCLFGALAALRPRQRVWAALPAGLSALAMACQLIWVAPYLLPNQTRHGAEVRVAALNLEFGQADPDQVIAAVREAEVVVLTEITPEARDALSRKGFDRLFPHRVGEGAPGVSGTSIHSRHPLQQVSEAGTVLESRLVRVRLPSGSLLVAGVHPINPMGGADAWAKDAARLRAWLAPHDRERVVVAGDFNAVDRHATMRPWFGAGYRSSADLTGAGLQPTWPTRGNGSIPLITIDHVLVSSSMTATSHRVFRVDGTDHAGVIATVAART